MLNVDVPDIPYEQLQGFEVTRLGKRHKAEPVVKATNPHGQTVYWVGAAGKAQDAGEGSDFYAIAHQKDKIACILRPMLLVSSTVNLSGWTYLTADNGGSGTIDVKYAITLVNTGNNFTGAVTSNGSCISLLNSKSGLVLGNTTATSNLTATSIAGDIAQTDILTVTGTTNITAAGHAINLSAAGNNLGATVTATGSGIRLNDGTHNLTTILTESLLLTTMSWSMLRWVCRS